MRQRPDYSEMAKKEIQQRLNSLNTFLEKGKEYGKYIKENDDIEGYVGFDYIEDKTYQEWQNIVLDYLKKHYKNNKLTEDFKKLCGGDDIYYYHSMLDILNEFLKIEENNLFKL